MTVRDEIVQTATAIGHLLVSLEEQDTDAFDYMALYNHIRNVESNENMRCSVDYAFGAYLRQHGGFTNSSSDDYDVVKDELDEMSLLRLCCCNCGDEYEDSDLGLDSNGDAWCTDCWNDNEDRDEDEDRTPITPIQE